MEIPLQSHYPVLMVVGKVDSWERDFTYSDKALLLYAIQNVANEYLCGSASLFSFAYDQQRLVWLIQLSAADGHDPVPDEEGWKRLVLFVQGTLEYIQEACKFLKRPVCFL